MIRFVTSEGNSMSLLLFWRKQANQGRHSGVFWGVAFEGNPGNRTGQKEELNDRAAVRLVPQGRFGAGTVPPRGTG